MSRKWTLLTLIFFLGSSGTLQANPLDSPGVVYIDGLPCNRACQSYMAWSRPSPARHREVGETNVVVPAEVEMENGTRSPPSRSNAAFASFRPLPRAGMAASNAKPSNTKASHTTKAAAPKLATRKAVPAAGNSDSGKRVEKTAPGVGAGAQIGSSDTVSVPGASIAAAPPTESPKPEVAKPEVAEPEVAKSEVAKSEIVKSEVAAPAPAKAEIVPPPATSEVAALPATAGTAPASALRTIQEQVVEATGMADRVTAITLEREAASKSGNQGMEPGAGGATDKTASGSPINPENLVALVLARPEINKLSDLNNRNIAIEEKQSAASGSVSAALMAAGAAEVQFSKVQTGALDRLISGEVPAAVLTLASPEAAESFPDIAGFRIFRVPLSQRARL